MNEAGVSPASFLILPLVSDRIRNQSMSSFKQFCWPMAVVSLGLLMAGCGGEEPVKGRTKVVPVQGKVMFQGTPLSGATVMFYAETAKLTASGMTDEQGVFHLRTYEGQDGAVPGSHKVTVKKSEGKTVPNPEDPNLPPLSSVEIWITPEEYASQEKTPLTAQVSESGPNDITLTITE